MPVETHIDAVPIKLTMAACFFTLRELRGTFFPLTADGDAVFVLDPRERMQPHFFPNKAIFVATIPGSVVSATWPPQWRRAAGRFFNTFHPTKGRKRGRVLFLEPNRLRSVLWM